MSLEWLNAASTATLRKYGDVRVCNIAICRTPIEKAFERALNILSRGRWEVAKGHDIYFHMYMCVTLDDGSDADAQCVSQRVGVFVHDYACSAGVAGIQRGVPCVKGAGRGCSGAGYRYVWLSCTSNALL